MADLEHNQYKQLTSSEWKRKLTTSACMAYGQEIMRDQLLNETAFFTMYILSRHPLLESADPKHDAIFDSMNVGMALLIRAILENDIQLETLKEKIEELRDDIEKKVRDAGWLE